MVYCKVTLSPENQSDDFSRSSTGASSGASHQTQFAPLDVLERQALINQVRELQRRIEKLEKLNCATKAKPEVAQDLSDYKTIYCYQCYTALMAYKHSESKNKCDYWYSYCRDCKNKLADDTKAGADCE